MRTFKLIIEYDGTQYKGWQVQPGRPTIQGVIQETLERLTGKPLSLIGSGRTDAGVHAVAQAAHFKAETRMDVPSIQRALNSLLPPDIVIKEIEEVDDSFHARRQTRCKLYEYRILNRGLRSAFHRGYAWHIPYPLDLGRMEEATEFLLGEHDFSSFRSAGSSTKSPVRRVIRAEWKRGRDGLVRFEIEGSGFLKQMVRSLVGTLVEVGRGKITPEEFRRILASKDRTKAGPTAPARGLFLKEVKY